MKMQSTELTWIHVQQKTFTNWVNEQLSVGGIRVSDLQEDLRDGVVLVRLVESLQFRRIGKICTNPKNQMQMLQNVDVAFRAIIEDKVKIVNIGNEDVVNGNLKLILGLIWHLIQRYQISATAAKSAPKKLMINCFRSFLPDRNLTNFSSDWRDGLALHELLENIKPGTCPNWKQLSPSSKEDNCRSAMRIAKEVFGIPTVVSPEDFASNVLDDLSGMTYLSYFLKPSSPGYFHILNWAKSILDDNLIQNLTTDWNDGTRLCRLASIMGATIPGLSKLNANNREMNCQKVVDAAKELNVFCPLSAKEIASPNIDHLSIMSLLFGFRRLKRQRLPNNEKYRLITPIQPIRIHEEIYYTFESCDIMADLTLLSAELQTPSTFDFLEVFRANDTNAAIRFVPRATGRYILRMMYAEETLAGFPVVLTVGADPSRAELISTAKPMRLGDASSIEVNVCNSGGGKIIMEARNTSTNEIATNIETSEVNAIAVGRFLPSEPGLWEVSIWFDNIEISGSPLKFPVCEPDRVRLIGPKVAKLEALMTFNVDCSLAGEAKLTAEVDDNGKPILCEIHPGEKPGEHKVNFVPMSTHGIILNVYFGGYRIPACPSYIKVLDVSEIHASGEGLTRGATGRAASFDVKAVRSAGELSVDVYQSDGLSIDPIWRQANETDFTFSYVPKLTGTFTVNVQWSGHHVKGSPFHPRIVDHSKIILLTDLTILNDEQGRLSLEPGEETCLEFSTKEAGPGKFTATVLGPNGRIPVTVHSEENKISVIFTALKEGDHYIHLYWCDLSLNISPLLGYCPGPVGEVNSSKVVVTGQGSVKSRALIPAEFIIDGRKAGKGIPEVIVRGIKTEIPVEIEPMKYNRYKCSYTAHAPGSYLAYVSWSGVTIPNMPLKINVTLRGDVSKVRVLEDGFRGSFVGKETKIIVDTRNSGPGDVTATCQKANSTFRCDTIENKDGESIVSVYPTEAGRFSLSIYYDYESVPGSPFVLRVGDPPDASQVRVRGPGIEDGLIHSFESTFLVETQGSGAGQLAVKIRGPKRAFKVDMKRETFNDRNIVCRYDPLECGHYVINVTWSGKHVPRSPFDVYIFDAQEELIVHQQKRNEPAERPRTNSLDQWSEDI